MQLEDDGWLEVSVKTVAMEDPEGTQRTDPQTVDVRVDLMATYCEIMDLSRSLGERPSEAQWLQGVRGIMDRLGFPPTSLALAERFADCVLKEVKARKKSAAGESKPDSPASTAQPS